MSLPRRRIIRPAAESTLDLRRQHQMQKLRQRLDAECSALDRWMRRLKRAFHSVERLQHTVSRLERQVTKLEG